MNILEKKTKELSFSKARWIEMVIREEIKPFYRILFKSKLVPYFMKKLIAKLQNIEIIERWNGTTLETVIKKNDKIIGTHKIKML